MQFGIAHWILVSILLLLGLAGCVKVEDETTSPGQTSGQSTPQNLTSQAKVITLTEPNSYHVEMPVPLGATVLLKTSDGGANNLEILLVANPTQYLDKEVIAGKTYHYAFGYYANQLFQKLSDENVAVPLDLVVEGKVDNSNGDKMDWSQYHRIFLRDKSIILTHGADLIIKTDEIYAWDAKIQSFESSAKADLGQGGRDGGKVEISTKKISGNLSFILNGESGGDGINGEAYTTAAVAGENGQASIRHLPNIEFERCIKTKNPSNGANGEIGRNGGNGGDGGDAGSVIIHYAEELNFKYIIEAKPGTGGRAGLGGPGQPGGARGGWNGSSCGEDMMGDLRIYNGAAGKNGEPGLAGQDGGVNRSCIYQNTQLVLCN